MPLFWNKKKYPAQHSRENYEDHRLKFIEWVDRLGLEKTFFGKWMVFIEERLRLRRFSLIFLFSMLLSYVLTWEVKTPTDFRIGEVAKVDIVSPLNFEMVDEVTTEEKRLRAEQDVPIIFDYDPLTFEKVSGGIYRSFRLMRSYLKNISWPKTWFRRDEVVKEFFSHKGEFEKEIGVQIPDYMFEWLVANQFSVRYENLLIKNLEHWYRFKIADAVERFIPNNQSTILARTVQKNNRGREITLQRKELVDVQNVENFTLNQGKGISSLPLMDRKNLESLAHLLLVPNLTLNKQEMATRRQTARDSVMPVTMSLRKSQIIVQEGSVVQPFHMALLKQIEHLKSDRRHDVVSLSMALVFMAVILIFFSYIRRFSLNKVRVENKDISMMGLVTLSLVALVKIFIFFTQTAFLSKFGSLIPASAFLYAAPVAAGPMLVGLLIPSGEVVWLFTAFLSIVLGILSDMNFSFMVLSFASGIAAARGVFGCKSRNDIYWAGVRTGLVSALMVALMTIVGKIDQDLFWRELFVGIPAGFVGGISSALVAMMFIPLLETFFNYTTDVRLLELSNLNHPLLKEMIVKAPGTYHHSMMVGSMVEAAAEEIGASPLLAKVMAYYHDIGKMEHANYYIENQKPGNNPHDHISPYMSKTLLIAHVKDGVELGMRYKLGKPIIDGVVQHHGTTLISYFYNKALDLRSEDDPEVSEDEFRYPGPKPQFREAALCMLADSIEAASRSLDEPTPVRLQNIVRNIVQRKFMEGQLDECNLTLKDLTKVEAAFTRILLGIYHQRIDYPKNAGGGASETPKNIFVASTNGRGTAS